MPKSSLRFRLAVPVVLLLLAVGAAAAMVRWAALPWALGEALKAGGATEVSFDVARVSPWRLQVDDIAFRLPATRVAAESVSLERRHWWSPSLGRLRVRTARVDVDLEQLAVIAAEPDAAPATATAVPALPLEGISVDGQVTVRAGDGDPAAALQVRFAAQPDAEGRWTGDARLEAPGLTLALEGDFVPATQTGGFRTTALEVDVATWQAWLENWVPLPFGPWSVSGTVSGALVGAYEDGHFPAKGDFHLRGARVANAGLGLVVDGVEADIGYADLTTLQVSDVALRARTITLADEELELVAGGIAADVGHADLNVMQAREIALRVGEIAVGKVNVGDFVTEVSQADTERIEVAALTAQALGGTVRVEPFGFHPGETTVEVVIEAESIRAEKVMALTQDLPARVAGPLSGRLPLRYEAGSLQLGTGWLGLAAGGSLEIQFQAEGLLTAGTSPKSSNYAVLKKIEDGLMKLNVTELRLDVRPPDAPGNRSAQLHIVGAPVDPQVKAPVTFDLNVNGPIESLINLGLKTGGGRQ